MLLQELNLTVWQPCKAPITSYCSFFQRQLANEKADSTLGRVAGSDPASVTSSCQNPSRTKAQTHAIPFASQLDAIQHKTTAFDIALVQTSEVHMSIQQTIDGAEQP